ncbi:MAG: deoxyribodipyrimidine photo-lyase [Isosphaera sp.]|nr:deoxyribodipyrimidine photo-lyase [Isosphaera sp.]
MRHLVWFRSDLRVDDNTALIEAADRATGGVVGLYVVSPGDFARHDWAACRVDFVLRNLAALSASLERLRIPLLIRTATRWQEVPAAVLAVAREHGCYAAHWNREHEVNEAARDARARRLLEEATCAVYEYNDQTVIPPGDLRTQGGKPYTVFTPFKRAWMARLGRDASWEPRPAPKPCPAMVCPPDPVPAVVPGWESPVDAALWPAGEAAAEARLGWFTARAIGPYKEKRDLPGTDGTSRLSPYLASGVISPRRCLRAGMEANGGRSDGGLDGPAHWVSELVWREFYKHVLASFPRVCKGRAFKPEAESVPWRDDPAGLAAWRAGRTGYPIVDAAMRQLHTTGWMHNRLRMIAAMFLTKDLLIDWRHGERFFMQRLVDGDLASNNGGWQWSASTGTDAAPYFRIYNPTTQSQRYDPAGAFIRAWVPELRGLSDDEIHEPGRVGPLRRSGLDYPEPIVDHAAARARALAAFGARDEGEHAGA